MTAREAAAAWFQELMLINGAEIEPRDCGWLDYTEPKNVFTRELAYVEVHRV